VTPAREWLLGRLQGAPPALLERMVEALPESDAPVPDVLAQAALDLYATVARGSGGREDALPLLAADALFTHAFEAQAERDPEEMATLVARCERGLGTILPC
jgi:hypothetical protein